MKHGDEQEVERYVLGTLPDTEAELFEEHFFDCGHCAARVLAQTLLSDDRTLTLSPRGGRFRLFTHPSQMLVAGSLAQAASLVSHGNAALASGQALQDDAWARLSAFNAANSALPLSDAGASTAHFHCCIASQDRRRNGWRF